MSVLDLKKERKDLYSPSAKDVSFVDVPEMRFLMIDGQGDPNTAESYKQAVEALYSVSYTLKFTCKKAGDPDYAVMPLEGLWWMDGEGFDYDHKDAWHWTMMIAQPEFVTAGRVDTAIAQARARKSLPGLDLLRFDAYREGPAAQIIYAGPYSDEGPTIQRIHAAIRGRGHRLAGKHHEIYLGDPRRTVPEKLKTVIRQPYA
jgi:hypothetical protein